MTLDLDSATDTAVSFLDAPGVTPPSTDQERKEFLSDVIIDLGLADRETVAEAVEASRELGQVVGEVLIDRGAISEGDLARAMAERSALPYVDLGEFEPDPAVQRLIGRAAALRYRAIPIATDTDGAIVVALADPLDALAVSDIAVITKGEVRPAVAARSAINSLIEALPKDADAPGAWRLNLSTAPKPRSTGAPGSDEPAAERDEGAANSEFDRAARALLERAIHDTGEAGGEEIEAERDRLRSQCDQLAAERDDLRAALEAERAARAEIEERAEREQANRAEMAKALEDAATEIDDLTARLEDAGRRTGESRSSAPGL